MDNYLSFFTKTAYRNNSLIASFCSTILIFIFAYAAISKLLDYPETVRQMLNQPIPDSIAHILSWLIPVIELALVLLLFFPDTSGKGFLLSTLLLAAFTLYVVMAMLNLFGDIACTCGGLISNLSWKEHLLFNIALLSLSITGFIIKRKEVVFR